MAAWTSGVTRYISDWKWNHSTTVATSVSTGGRRRPIDSHAISAKRKGSA